MTKCRRTSLLNNARGSVRKATNLLFEWDATRAMARTKSVRQGNLADVDPMVRLTNSNAGEMKCNVDTTLFSQEGKYGIGMCVFEMTEFVKANIVTFSGTPLPQEAKAMGFKYAIKWFSELGIQSITIELDCLPAVNGMNGTIKLNSDFGSILISCKTLLSNVQSYRINYIRRQTNLITLSLAKASRLYVTLGFLISVQPVLQ